MTLRRRLLVMAIGALVHCGSGEHLPAQPTLASQPPSPYLTDAAFRRRELLDSLVDVGNHYSLLRLAHYATGDRLDWDALPEWNPRTQPIAVEELDGSQGALPATLSSIARALTLPEGPPSESDTRLVRLGQEAFERYPTQLAPYAATMLASRESAARFGLWLDPQRGVGGLVRAEMADGSVLVAATCATCHAARGLSGIDNGRPNALLDIGSAITSAGPGAPDVHGEPGRASLAAPADPVAAWGAGRLDVTTDAGTEPARIADLRPVRWLTHLHQDATLVLGSPSVLATRIETQIITAHGQVLRPPRVVALALAMYVRSLADSLPSSALAERASPEGAGVFRTACVSCHTEPSLTGAPVPLSEVGTDPVLGLSLDRGTGRYRVPSLHGVGTRGPLLHDGSVASAADLLDPVRPTSEFTRRLHGTGAVAGHLFGLDLPPAQREALVRYLQML